MSEHVFSGLSFVVASSGDPEKPPPRWAPGQVPATGNLRCCGQPCRRVTSHTGLGWLQDGLSVACATPGGASGRLLSPRPLAPWSRALGSRSFPETAGGPFFAAVAGSGHPSDRGYFWAAVSRQHDVRNRRHNVFGASVSCGAGLASYAISSSAVSRSARSMGPHCAMSSPRLRCASGWVSSKKYSMDNLSVSSFSPA